jgi:hypothetical protein
MKQPIRFAVAALCLSLMSVASAVAQDQYTEGGVTRVTLVQIFLRWMKSRHFCPS